MSTVNASNEARRSGRSISVVIPVLNDAKCLSQLLRQLRSLGLNDVIVVDGGSDDSPRARIENERFLQCDANRGRQVALGVREACGDLIWILHADSMVSSDAVDVLRYLPHDRPWGRFDIQFDNRLPLFRLIAKTMNLRSAWSGICTGDQGMFIARSLLKDISMFPQQPLMEDIELSRMLKKNAAPFRVRTPIQTSARKWEVEGVFVTIFRMAWIRLLYFVGVPPDILVRWYYRKASTSA